MTPARLIAIGLIYCCSAIAWFVLGGTIVGRTGESDSRLAQEVAQLWGGRHNQVAPSAQIERPRVVLEDVKDNKGLKIGEIRKTVVDEVPVALDSSRVAVSLALDHRRRLDADQAGRRRPEAASGPAIPTASDSRGDQRSDQPHPRCRLYPPAGNHASNDL